MVRFQHELCWIVKDGKSTDGTREWLESVCADYNFITVIYSHDNGIYSGMNQAIDYVRTSKLMFLNCGDLLIELPKFEEIDLLSIYPVITNGQKIIKPKYYCNFLFACHQGVVFSTEIHRAFRYNENLELGADFDVINLIRQEYPSSFKEYPDVCVQYELGGVSDIRRKVVIGDWLSHVSRSSKTLSNKLAMTLYLYVLMIYVRIKSTFL